MELDESIIIDEPLSDVFTSFKDFKNFRWRRDLKNVEKLDQKHYIEYSKKNYPTFYTVAKKKKDTFYELELTNNWLEGHISYDFEKVELSTKVHIHLEVKFVDSKPLFISKRRLRYYFKKYIADIQNMGK